MENDMHRSITELTLEEFSDFLTRKNIPSECQRCSSQALQISMQEIDPEQYFVRVIQSTIVRADERIFPFYMRICTNCSSVEHYSAVLVIEELRKHRNKESNKMTHDGDGDAK